MTALFCFAGRLSVSVYCDAPGVVATDDAALVERLGSRVVVVEGSPENFKITGPLDLPLAEAILRRRGG